MNEEEWYFVCFDCGFRHDLEEWQVNQIDSTEEYECPACGSTDNWNLGVRNLA